jgi:hypothetical protein
MMNAQLTSILLLPLIVEIQDHGILPAVIVAELIQVHSIKTARSI